MWPVFRWLILWDENEILPQIENMRRISGAAEGIPSMTTLLDFNLEFVWFGGATQQRHFFPRSMKPEDVPLFGRDEIFGDFAQCFIPNVVSLWGQNIIGDRRKENCSPKQHQCSLVFTCCKPLTHYQEWVNRSQYSEGKVRPTVYSRFFYRNGNVKDERNKTGSLCRVVANPSMCKKTVPPLAMFFIQELCPTFFFKPLFAYDQKKKSRPRSDSVSPMQQFYLIVAKDSKAT